jgi:hypothetical protein
MFDLQIIIRAALMGEMRADKVYEYFKSSKVKLTDYFDNLFDTYFDNRFDYFDISENLLDQPNLKFLCFRWSHFQIPSLYKTLYSTVPSLALVPEEKIVKIKISTRPPELTIEHVIVPRIPLSLQMFTLLLMVIQISRIRISCTMGEVSCVHHPCLIAQPRIATAYDALFSFNLIFERSLLFHVS